MMDEIFSVLEAYLRADIVDFGSYDNRIWIVMRHIENNLPGQTIIIRAAEWPMLEIVNMNQYENGDFKVIRTIDANSPTMLSEIKVLVTTPLSG